MTPTAAVRKAFAPAGSLRAAINLENPILATRGGDGGARGVAAALARHGIEGASVAPAG